MTVNLAAAIAIFRLTGRNLYAMVPRMGLSCITPRRPRCR